jgi:hypothetical protein
VSGLLPQVAYSLPYAGFDPAARKPPERIAITSIHDIHRCASMTTNIIIDSFEEDKHHGDTDSFATFCASSRYLRFSFALLSQCRTVVVTAISRQGKRKTRKEPQKAASSPDGQTKDRVRDQRPVFRVGRKVVAS